MSYFFSKAIDISNIKNQEYGISHKTIIFSKMRMGLDIGIISRKGRTLTGIHLSLLLKNGMVFSKKAISEVVLHLGEYDQIIIIGFVNSWEYYRPDEYKLLLKNLNNYSFQLINENAISEKYKVEVIYDKVRIEIV